MAILKCKMCGGDLQIIEGQTVCECDSCGTKQTVPTLDNEKKLTLFTRANRLRLMCEFDKAYNVYESIVSEFPEEAEAYWGLILCKYGIEYVDDPRTGEKIPTCHRSSFDPVMEDDNYQKVLRYADAAARRVYQAEAEEIERIRSGILEISSKEKPYDIFICYKETDENGRRTEDSMIAQDVYTELTQKGYRVFFSRVTLRGKLGQEYEPYIFAALHSAKIMLAFGTSYDYFNAVWVKNEWSRYLALMAKGEKKKLIPCYKSIDAYDMPQEFKRLQGQDMGSHSAMLDLLRAVEETLPLKKAQPAGETVVVQQGTGASSILRRGFDALSMGEFEKARSNFDTALDFNPDSGEAYLGKLMAALKVRRREQLVNQPEPFDGHDYYREAMRLGDEKLKKELSEANETIRNTQRADNCYNAEEYDEAFRLFKQAAEAGNANAQVKLGWMYQKFDVGVSNGEELAFEWYRKSAEQENQAGLNNLAYCYDNGIGVPENEEKALECYLKASALGNGYASKNAGFLYDRKDRPFSNPAKAAQYYQLAVDRGVEDDALMNNLGYCYLHGIGFEKDLAKARALYEKAVALGSETAKRNLDYLKGLVAEMIRDADRLFAEGNLRKAMDRYREAADTGDEEAEFWVSMMQYLNDGQFADADEVFRNNLDDFADDYRIRWGLVCTATNNLTTVPEDRELAEHYHSALQYAPEDVAETLRGRFREACAAEVRRVNASIADVEKANRPMVAQIQQKFADLQARKNEHKVIDAEIESRKMLEDQKKRIAQQGDVKESETKGGATGTNIFVLIVLLAVIAGVLIGVMLLTNLCARTLSCSDQSKSTLHIIEVVIALVIAVPLVIFSIKSIVKDNRAVDANRAIKEAESDIENLQNRKNTIRVEDLEKEVEALREKIKTNNQQIEQYQQTIRWYESL